MHARWIMPRKFSTSRSHRVTSRRQLCSQAKNRSTTQRRRYRRSGRPSCVAGRTRLSLCGAIRSNGVLMPQFFVERVAVVGFVADQPRREVREEAVVERRADEPDFRGRSAGHVDGDRKTAAVDDCHDFVALATFRRPNGGAPFFAPVQLASIKPSVRSSLPRSRRSSASRSRMSRNSPVRRHC